MTEGAEGHSHRTPTNSERCQGRLQFIAKNGNRVKLAYEQFCAFPFQRSVVRVSAMRNPGINREEKFFSENPP